MAFIIERKDFTFDAKKIVEESNESKMEIVQPEEKKFEKKEQMSINNDKKRENGSVKNSLIKRNRKRTKENLHSTC